MWILTERKPSRKMDTVFEHLHFILLSQWLSGFKLLGIPYLVGKRKFKLLFQGLLAKSVLQPGKYNLTACLSFILVVWEGRFVMNFLQRLGS